MDGGPKLTNNVYSFRERKRFSAGERRERDIQVIEEMLDGCIAVRIGDEEEDRKGIDYVITLHGGAQVYVDAKARDKGCSRHWRNGPELALEDYSVVPENGHSARMGWTFDESKLTDLVLFTFDLSDTELCYLLPFQLLRVAAKRNWLEWSQRYKNDEQDSGLWKSHCVFVPASAIMNAIMEVSILGACSTEPLQLALWGST